MKPREERKMRLELLIKKLRVDPQSSLKGILAWGMLEWGVSRSVMRDYLTVLLDSSIISIDEDTEDGDGVIFWERKE